jgi:SAM-dependent methyltransferase
MSKRNPTASEFALSEFDPAIERAFFGRVVLANGSFKTTNASRLDDLNRAMLPYIKSIPSCPVDVLDVAASSGISTQEWRDSLVAAGVDSRVTGTDLTTEALHLAGTLVDVLVDRKSNIIHLSLIGVAAHPRVLKAIRRSGLGAMLIFAARRICSARPFRLVSKGVRDVRLLEEDFEDEGVSPQEQFHVIRVANILNLAYFSEARLRAMVIAILRRLRPGGLLVVCRTHQDESNHATILRFQNSTLCILERLGSGSELESILLSVQAVARTT